MFVGVDVGCFWILLGVLGYCWGVVYIFITFSIVFIVLMEHKDHHPSAKMSLHL